MTLTYPVARHQLRNGLHVVASEDHAAPAATVHLHYDVGSRHEASAGPGSPTCSSTWFFEGSARVAPGEHALLLQSCGAVFNGSTATDLTVYFEHLPAGALELALWLDADRMATHGDGLTQELLDNKRAVITQENASGATTCPTATSTSSCSAWCTRPGTPTTTR